MALFVTFEGLDGSGKSTQLRRVAAWLEGHGVPLLVTQEPGGTALGERVRHLFLDKTLRPADGIVEALLVFASRRQHLVETIEPALRRGEHVLCDRFTDSTVAYQGVARGLGVDFVRRLDRLATGGRRPDLTLLFDLPVATALRRQGERQQDRLDAETTAFHRRVRAGYRELARREPRRVVRLDAGGTLEETERRVRRRLARAFGLPTVWLRRPAGPAADPPAAKPRRRR